MIKSKRYLSAPSYRCATRHVGMSQPWIRPVMTTSIGGSSAAADGSATGVPSDTSTVRLSVVFALFVAVTIVEPTGQP